jgi:dTDP-4-dehydrorhamnose reductase
VLGAGGRLGRALVREYGGEFEVNGITHAELDLARLKEVKSVISAANFDLLINCAALTQVDYCESHRDEAFLVNAEAPRIVAESCRSKGARLIHISTDYVFDGASERPYSESDRADPVSVYGESKLAGEDAVLCVSPEFAVVRVSWVFGPDRPSFIDQVISRARDTSQVSAVADKISTPTYTLDAALWLRRAWENEAGGVLHLANAGQCSWQEYAQHGLDCCRAAGVELAARQVEPLKLAEMRNFIARRPVYSVLCTEKFTQLTGVKPRSWREAVAEYIGDYIAKR